jgi:hypothetical protein
MSKPPTHLPKEHAYFAQELCELTVIETATITTTATAALTIIFVLRWSKWFYTTTCKAFRDTNLPQVSASVDDYYSTTHLHATTYKSHGQFFKATAALPAELELGKLVQAPQIY